MVTYLLGPGAWLNDGGTTGSGLNPPVANSVRRALGWGGPGANPTPRGGKGNSVWNPDPGSRRRQAVGNGGDWNPTPDDGNSHREFPWPWRGLDPDWVYDSGGASLLAQAIRRMQAKVVRPGDPRLPANTTGALRPRQGGVVLDPIWRWGSEYRVRAGTAELAARFFVEDKTLYFVDRQSWSANKKLLLSPTATLTISSTGINYATQVDKVLRAAIEREDRLPEILTQSDDFWPFFNAITGLHPSMAPRTAELLEVAWQWTDQIVMAFKHQIAELRPVQRSALVTTVIDTPAHGSLPSGHATFANLTARLLSELLYAKNSERAMQLDLLARRIAFNRVVAGVHFPADSAAGYALGRQLSDWFVTLAAGGNGPSFYETHPGTKDIELRETRAPAPPRPPAAAAKKVAPPAAKSGKSGIAVAAPTAVMAVPLLSTLWAASIRELNQLRVRG